MMFFIFKLLSLKIIGGLEPPHLDKCSINSNRFLKLKENLFDIRIYLHKRLKNFFNNCGNIVLLIYIVMNILIKLAIRNINQIIYLFESVIIVYIGI